MFEASAKKITSWMEKNQIIPPEKAVATQWGIWHLLSSGFSLLAFVVIGILMHMLPQTIVFTVGYIPLRTYAGGYHSKTPLRCWAVSNLILIAALLLVRYVSRFTVPCIIAAVCCVLLMIVLMPVADLHKPLDSVDRKRYKTNGCILLCIEAAAAGACFLLHWHSFGFTVMSVWVLLTVMMLLGLLKNRLARGSA